MLSSEIIKREAEEMARYTVETYRALHRYPEVAHHEMETNRTIRKELDKYGVTYLAPAGNITIALIGHGSGATVGLRCDTDALPVQEETGLPFSSVHPCVMHACGHDAHTAVGLSVALMLKKYESELSGVVKIIFQPAEEGEGGADEVLATGLVQDIDVFFALHVWSPYASGTLHASVTAVSAAVNMFTIRISGRGGHGATPEKCADAVVAGAAIVTQAQAIVARALSPMEPAVLTIGSFHAGMAGNVIAGEAILKGTIRSLNEETRARVSSLLEQTAVQVAALYGCKAEVENIRVSDAVINDERATELARACAHEIAPEKELFPQKTMMLGDDFADYDVIAPYCYAQVGIADAQKGTDAAHHNCRFRVDEDVLPLCVKWMACFAVRACEVWPKKESKR